MERKEHYGRFHHTTGDYGHAWRRYPRVIYLATAAGFRIMQQGGNAIDAAATMGFCLNLLEPQSNGIGGEVSMLIYSAPAREVFAISGMGWSPQAFTIDWCRAHGLDLIPGDGYLPACVPAVVDTWATSPGPFWHHELLPGLTAGD